MVLTTLRTARGSVGRMAASCAVALLLATAAHAQSNAPCPEGFPRSADLAISNLEGNFEIRFERVQDDPVVIRRVWKFYEEPRVSELDPSGPSIGRLKEGDVLVAIDGALIKTGEAGRRIGALDPDRTVKLTVRRDGKTQDVRVRPRSRCPDDQLANRYRSQMRTPRPPRPPRPPRTPSIEVNPVPVTPPAPPAMVRRKMAGKTGWFGVGLNCGDCGWVMLEDNAVWRSNEFPVIYLVEPGSPAAKGGLQRDDKLTEINGVSLLSEEGGRLFGSVKPGQEVKWTVEREGETKNVTVVAGVRPGSELEQLRRIPIKDLDDEELRKQMEQLQKQFNWTSRRTPSAEQRLRWTGSVGDADITVNGQSHVQVTTDEETGDIVITTADATIRVKKSDSKKKGDK